MIVVRLIGSLGNQMFQYATARSHPSHDQLCIINNLINKQDEENLLMSCK